MLSKDLFGDEFFKKYGRIYASLQSGMLEGGTLNKDLPKDTIKILDRIFSEADAGNFSFRGLALLKFLGDHKNLEEYKRHPDRILSPETPDKYLLNFKGEEVLNNLDQDGAMELVSDYWQIKKQSIEKMIDIIVNSEKYRGTSGKSLKDSFYKEQMLKS